MCGAPTLEKFKLLLKAGFLHNCPVTAKDINNAEKIFGPDILTLKGRTTWKTPPVVRDTVVEIPPELLHQKEQLTMFIDVMFVQGQPVLTAIDSVFKNRSTVWMADRSFKEFYAAIDHVTRAYNKNGYRFAKMHCDREFKPCLLYTSPSPRDLSTSRMPSSA